ncbi:protease [Kineobactrum sediminis]|uniref:Protease n=1 Tax=Kineobactrum sediminis TaxID=1905677 RepID=A0A2N5Y4Q5_9GAMM|nr:trypsin-like peptidase domain-containing protein [Kineobactrum sediminis]PLW83380.1 protease [Kineobactrum sediminis]
MPPSLRFITWPTIAGLLAALLILDRWVLPPEGNARMATETGSYATAVHQATPAVVNIYTAKLIPTRPGGTRTNPFSSQAPQRQRIERSLGSGVIMTDQGHVLTNNHVIHEADAIEVLLHDGRSANAVVIGTDPATDLAVLQIKLPDLQPIALANSDTARVGDVVLAIGNPLGFGHSVTQGIVSALGRYGLQLSLYEDYIQTDATIHLGNSGGALINTRGQLLGINTLIYTGNEPARGTPTGIGISLAIPANLALFVMDDLIRYGEVIRGWLGVSVGPVRGVDGSGPSAQLLEVTAVAEGGPAQRAGIQVGDIITHIDGEPARDGRLTMHRIAQLRPGDNIEITVQRNQQSIDLRAIVGTLRQSPSR